MRALFAAVLCGTGLLLILVSFLTNQSDRSPETLLAVASPKNDVEHKGDPFILIEKETNQLLFFRGDKLIRSMTVASGENAKDTPEGEFRVVVKGRYPDWLNSLTRQVVPGGTPENPLGSRWIGLDVPGTAGYIYGIHGTNNEASIGQYVTEGCIRLTNDHVEWLYDQADVGTKVVIRGAATAESADNDKL